MEGSIICHHKTWLQELRTCHLKINCYAILTALRWMHLKNSKCRDRLSLNLLLCLKTGGPRGIPLSWTPPAPEECYHPKRTGSGRQRRLEVDATPTQTATILPPTSSSKCPFGVPKTHSLSHQETDFPPRSLLKWYFSLNSKPPGRVTHASLDTAHVYMNYTC